MCMGHSTAPQGVGIGSRSSTSSLMGPTLGRSGKLGSGPMPLPPGALLSQAPRETDTLGTTLGCQNALEGLCSLTSPALDLVCDF